MHFCTKLKGFKGHLTQRQKMYLWSVTAQERLFGLFSFIPHLSEPRDWFIWSYEKISFNNDLPQEQIMFARKKVTNWQNPKISIVELYSVSYLQNINKRYIWNMLTVNSCYEEHFHFCPFPGWVFRRPDCYSKMYILKFLQYFATLFPLIRSFSSSHFSIWRVRVFGKILRRVLQVRPFDDKEAEEYKMVLYRFAERCSFHLSDIQVSVAFLGHIFKLKT